MRRACREQDRRQQHKSGPWPYFAASMLMTVSVALDLGRSGSEPCRLPSTASSMAGSLALKLMVMGGILRLAISPWAMVTLPAAGRAS
jgi:hypothetical protein